jgi:hypothetical protein
VIGEELSKGIRYSTPKTGVETVIGAELSKGIRYSVPKTGVQTVIGEELKAEADISTFLPLETSCWENSVRLPWKIRCRKPYRKKGNNSLALLQAILTRTLSSKTRKPPLKN